MDRDASRLIITGIIGALLGGLLAFAPFFRRIELNYFDFLQGVSFNDSEADVAVVKLDKKTTDMLGWPIGRDIYAAMIDVVKGSGAKKIGFDLFFDSRPGGESGGEILAKEQILGEMSEKTDTILASYVTTVDSETVVDNRKKFYATPEKSNYYCDTESFSGADHVTVENSYLKQLVPGVREYDVRLAHVHLIPSEVDGVYRRIVPCYPVYDGCVRDLGLSLVGKNPDPGTCMRPRYIPYLRSAEEIPAISMADVIELSATEDGGEQLRKIFSDRFVLFAATAKTLKDLGPTPGAEIEPLVHMHVNRIESLLSGYEISVVDRYLVLAVGFIIALFFVFFMNRGKVLFSLALLSLPLSFGLSWALFAFLSDYIPVLHFALPLFTGLISASGYRGWQYFMFNRVLSQAFDTYVSPEILNWLKDTGGKVLSAESAERREITILFSDIAGYTSMSNALSADAIMKSLRYYLDEMMDVTAEHLGYVDKINGDGLMILFGSPKRFNGHAEFAVNCACEMQKRVAEMQDVWDEITGKELRIRVGVATGTVFVGNLGGEGHIEYSAIGRNVNLSARLESASEIGGVLVSYDCYKKLRDKPDAWERFVSLKGYDDPVRVCQVIPRESQLEKRIEKDSDGSVLIPPDFYEELKEKPAGTWEEREGGDETRRMFRVELVEKTDAVDSADSV